MPETLPQELRAAIERHWGFPSLRPLQEQAIRAALDGSDSLVVLPTGGGKSLCYQAPAIVRSGLTVVVSPLISLMKDQVDGLARIGVPAVRLDSAQSPYERSDAIAAIRGGEARLVFTSPERLVNTDVHRVLRESGAHTVAVDEAHCVSHWGHDFRPEYRQLSQLREFFPGVSIHGYTATATERVRRDIVEQLRLHRPELLVGNFDRPNLSYRVLPRLDLFSQLREVLDRHKGDAGIIYCLRRRDVDDVSALLRAAGYRAAPYHAGMTSEDRLETQEAFAAERVDIVVATVAFGMGIDRSNVRYVLHAAMPKSVEHYQQETGRAGRDGLPSECLLLFSMSDVITFRTIIQKSAEEAGASPEYLRATLGHLEEMARYCRGATCRHKALVEYFGQEYETPNCGACDQCLGDTREVPDATVIAQKILSCVARVKESFGVNHVIDILRGADTDAIRSRGHNQLSTYGLLRDVPKADLRDWVYQLIGQGVLVQDGTEFPVLKLNAASWAVMKGERTARLVWLAEKETSKRSQPGALPEGADAGLFEELRKLRREEAARAEIQPYMVFHDTVLAEMARGRPTTEEVLRGVSGVGDFKLQSFGRQFLDAIRDYCQRTGLPTDVPTPKTPAAPPPSRTGSLSAAKSLAFQLFRDGALVEEVIHQTKMSPSTVNGYLADFILAEKPASIFHWVPEDVCERVAAAAEIHGTAKLKPVFLELNEEVSYEHIKVVFAFLQSRGELMPTERERMLAGELYDSLDPELVRLRERARDLCHDLNASRERDVDLRRRILTELFGRGGESVWMQPPFFCDYGSNILLGERVFFNFNCVVLDVCRVTIGDFTSFGPTVQIYTAMHPFVPDLRRKQEFGKTVEIGTDVWVGGGAIICPGVTIGSRSVIGAGSVVTRDIPAGVLAVGNPCRVLKEITE